jgi:hypothetical protein
MNDLQKKREFGFNAAFGAPQLPNSGAKLPATQARIVAKTRGSVNFSAGANRGEKQRCTTDSQPAWLDAAGLPGLGA